MSNSPYFNVLGAQPGVQIDMEPTEAFELSAVADQVVAMGSRASRGPIDRPFMVTREDVDVRLGAARSNLVRADHEARMQIAEALDAGAAGVVVSRLASASAVKRYASVSLGTVAAVDSVVVTLASAASVTEGASLVATVTMSSSAGASGVAYSLSGLTVLDMGDASFSHGVTSNGSALSVPAGVVSFTITIPILADQTTEGSETLTVSVGGMSYSVLVQDAAPPATDGAAILALMPALWIDPSDESLMTKTGSLIETIQDRSGNGRHGAKSGSPSFSSDNLLGGIRLSNGGFDLAGAALSMQQYTVFAIVYLDLVNQTAKSIAFLANGNIAVGCNSAMIFTSGTQSVAGLQVASSSAYAYTGGVPAIGVGVPHLVTLKQKAAWVDCEFTLDGSQQLPRINTSGNTPTATFTFIGKQSTYASQGWELGEMVVIPRATSEEEDSIVEAYLKAKWGVA